MFGCSIHTRFCLYKNLSSGKWHRLCTCNNRQTCPAPQLICSSVSREIHLAQTWHIFRRVTHYWGRMEATRFDKICTSLSVHEITLISPADKIYVCDRLTAKIGCGLQFELKSWNKRSYTSISNRKVNLALQKVFLTITLGDVVLRFLNDHHNVG